MASFSGTSGTGADRLIGAARVDCYVAGDAGKRVTDTLLMIRNFLIGFLFSLASISPAFAAKVGDLVRETTTSTGTGNLTVTVQSGSRTFNAEWGTGGTDVFYYFITHQSAAEWEIGTGHLSAATTLVRDTVISSSNANALVNFSAGTKDVFNDHPVDTVPTANLEVGLGFSGGAAIRVADDNAPSFYRQLSFESSPDATANRFLDFILPDADTQLTLTGNATISGTNTGDQTITLTGNVTGSGTGSFAATIANDAVTFAKMQDVAANSVPARAAATSGDLSEVALSASQLLGRGSTGNVAAIALGTGLSMSGTTLSASAGGAIDIQSFTSSGTWTKPASGTWAFVQCWGAGASGGSSTNTTTRGGGGGGGAYIEAWLLLSSLGATETVTIGAGGAGITSGNGTAGGATTFGTWMTAYGGRRGGGGVADASGGGGSGALAAGGNASGATAGVGGEPNPGAAGSAGVDAGYGGLGGGGGADGGSPPNAAGNSYYGGGGGGGSHSTSASTGSVGGDSIMGGAGGGAASGTGTGSAGGTSKGGGNGGAGGNNSTAGTAGTQPAGGGGGSANNNSSGAGGAGKLVVMVF